MVLIWAIYIPWVNTKGFERGNCKVGNAESICVHIFWQNSNLFDIHYSNLTSKCYRHIRLEINLSAFKVPER